MSSVRGKPNSSFVHELTIQQEKCLVKHAREIFTKLVPAETRLGLTDANRKSVEAAASTSLEIAEVFQRKLMEAGYGVRTEETKDAGMGKGSGVSDESSGGPGRAEQAGDGD